MKRLCAIFLLRFVSLVSSFTCYTSTVNFGSATWPPGIVVGQVVYGVPESGWISSSFQRNDDVQVDGTFYIIPGRDANTANAVFSKSFSFNTFYVYTNGSFYLTPGANYTFLWQNEGTNTSSFFGTNDATEYIPGAFCRDGSFDNIADMSGQFCFDTLTVPTPSPTPSTSPTPSVTPTAAPTTAPAGLTCYTSTSFFGYADWEPGTAVGQSFVTVPRDAWILSGFQRYDTNHVNGTFYIVPGISNNLSAAIYSTPFTFNTSYVYTTGYFPLTVGNPYTFLWNNEGSTSSSFYGTNDANDYINGSYYYGYGFQTVADMTGQFCFDTVQSSATPTPSMSASVAASTSASTTPSPNWQLGVGVALFLVRWSVV